MIMDPIVLAILGTPSGYSVAGAVFATGLYLDIYKKITRYLKRMKTNDRQPLCLRSKVKKEILRSAMKEGATRKPSNLLKSIHNYVKNKPKVIVKINYRKQNTVEDWKKEIQELIEFCCANENVKFPYALPYWKQESAKKIAEGSFGEIYSFHHVDGSPRIFKCMPVGDRHPLKKSPSIPMKYAIPEIVCSISLSKLNDGPFYAAPNFPEVYRVCIVKDKFPSSLMNTWWEFKAKELTEHPQPDLFNEDQKFLTIEASFCGNPLTKDVVSDAWLGASIMTQLVSALAVAEEAFNFEHRDLHLSNILIRQTDTAILKYTLGHLNFAVKTMSHQVFIIDFTLSRINDGTRIHSTPVERSSNAELFGPENFWLEHGNVYEKMAAILQNDYNTFMPKTNIFWLKYINETIIDFLKDKNPSLIESEINDFDAIQPMRLLHRWNDYLLEFNSARAFLEAIILQENPLIEAIFLL